MKVYTEKEIMSKFNKKTPALVQVRILKRALKLSLEGNAGTKEYAIARAMGYKYEDDGSYTKSNIR